MLGDAQKGRETEAKNLITQNGKNNIFRLFLIRRVLKKIFFFMLNTLSQKREELRIGRNWDKILIY